MRTEPAGAVTTNRARVESVDLVRGVIMVLMALVVRMFVVIAMYAPCKWFAALERARNEAWLSYPRVRGQVPGTG